jgi:putative PEP-CTERM system TPR-repeat lipoprotein
MRPIISGVRSLPRIVFAAALGLLLMAAGADNMTAVRDALAKGDLRTAQVTLRKIVRADPQNAEAHYRLGWVSIQLGDAVAAEREADAAQQRGFDTMATTRLLGQALLAQYKFDALLKVMQPQGKDPALDAAIQVLRGYALIGLGRREEAQAAFDAAKRLAPSSPDALLGSSRLALMRRDLDTARTAIDAALALQPKDAEALLARAQVLRMGGDLAGALTVLNGLLGDQPSVPDMVQARLDRAGLEIALNKTDAATADIAAVEKVVPTSVQAIYLKAALAMRAQDYAAADGFLQRISSFIPRVPSGYFLLALVKERLGQLEQAEEAARHYLVNAPDDLDAYKLLARIQLDKRRADMAIETLRPLVTSGKADAETYDLLGNAYALGGQPEQSVHAYQQERAMAPGDVAVQTRLAGMQVDLGRPFAAVTDLEHALAVSPKVPQMSEALFFATLATGDLVKTRATLDKIKATEGDSVTVQYLEAILKQTELDLDGARQMLTMITRFRPDYLPARIGLAHLLALQGHGDEADRVLADILKQYPTNEPALTLLASDYTRTGRMADAVALLERARAAEPNNMPVLVKLGHQYIAAGKPQAALDLVLGINDERRLSVPMRVLAASAEEALGQKDKARDTLRQVLVSNPQELGVRQQLIGSLVAAGDYESARNVIKDGLATMPRNYSLLQAYVLVDLKASGIDTALATADLLQSQDRDYAPARALRGDVFMAVNRPDDAAATYAKALEAAPDTPMLTHLIGAQIRGGHLELARTTALQWLQTHSDDLVALEELAQIDIGLGRLDEAVQALWAILAKKSYDPVALNNLAWVYHEQHDDRAVVLAREAYLLSPDARNADTLGWILTTGGRPDLGVDVLRQAAAETGGNPSILYHYAIALMNTGGAAQATSLLTALTSMKADFPEKAQARAALDLLKHTEEPAAGTASKPK